MVVKDASCIRADLTARENCKASLQTCRCVPRLLQVFVCGLFAGGALKGSNVNIDGLCLFIGGQKRNPSDGGSPVVWKIYTSGASQPLTYHNWIAEEPNSEGSPEPCLCIKPTFHYKWNDVRCDIKSYFICEL